MSGEYKKLLNSKIEKLEKSISDCRDALEKAEDEKRITRLEGELEVRNIYFYFISVNHVKIRIHVYTQDLIRQRDVANDNLEKFLLQKTSQSNAEKDVTLAPINRALKIAPRNNKKEDDRPSTSNKEGAAKFLSKKGTSPSAYTPSLLSSNTDLHVPKTLKLSQVIIFK